jgi:hypothetical protein
MRGPQVTELDLVASPRCASLPGVPVRGRRFRARPGPVDAIEEATRRRELEELVRMGPVAGNNVMPVEPLHLGADQGRRVREIREPRAPASFSHVPRYL